MRNWRTVFQSGCDILHSHQQWMWVPVAPHPFHSLGGINVLNFGYFIRCAMVSHCCLYFLDGIWCGTSTHRLICHFSIFFDEVPFKVFGPFLIRFVFFMLSFKSFLYILDNSPISGAFFSKYFLTFCGMYSHSLDKLNCSLLCFFFLERSLKFSGDNFGRQITAVGKTCYLIEEGKTERKFLEVRRGLEE